MSDDLPEPDRVEGAPHPRDCPRLIGQEAAESAFLEAFNSGRLHHGWLITGPRGVGKATFAWKVARFLLATPEPGGGLFAAPAPDRLDIAPDHLVARRMAAGGEGRLLVLRRPVDEKTGRLRQDITVDEMRKLRGFLGLSAPDGGQRVVIVDSADEMNPSAANALLKFLEEPPDRVVFLLVSHQPARLLPTIRSRCRHLRLGALGAVEIAAAMEQAGADVTDARGLAQLAGGSVGEAIRLATLEGLATYGRLVEVFATMPGASRPMILSMAEAVQGRGAEARFDLVLRLLDLLLARLARAGASGVTPPEAARGEAALLARLAPDPQAARVWADMAQALGARARRGRSVNLDPAALVLDMLVKIDATADRICRSPA